ncbi:hypothetical protein EC957_011462 [Mortierella hygrophila]|uniref:Kelch repeat-containing protein n=1 Tax=Mortierella hygrophila TaxID=979708 RepID=A0A9P6FHX2_9FUNG|nr:hypothetical protein EC957_011462 [Mortierella hygrophila]
MKVRQVVGQTKAVTRVTLVLSPLLVLATLFFPSSVSAQGYLTLQPAPVYQFEHTSFPDRTLYVRGGLNQGRFVPQFFSLDISPLLTYSNQLTWKKLNETGTITDFRSRLPMAVNRQNQALTYFAEGGWMTSYNIVTDKWASSTVPLCLSPDKPLNSVRGTQKAVMDPKSGLMYIPLGYNHQKEMLVFDATGNDCSSLPMPANSKWYNHAWSESKNTIYIYGVGAAESAEVPGSLWEFQFATKSWKLIPLQGDTPILHEGNCMTSALGGQKLIVHGGVTTGNVYSDIYIFDTVTYKWTKGPNSPTNRSEAACASSGDFFLTWGGYDAPTGFLSPPEILFYNIKYNKWMTQAEIAPPSSETLTATAPLTATTTLAPTTAPVFNPNPNHGSGSGSGSGNSGGTSNNSGSINTGLTDAGSSPEASKDSSAAAIGGGVAGVVFIAAFVGFFFYRRGRKAGIKDRGGSNIEALAGDNLDEYQQAPYAPNSQNSAHQDPNAINNSYGADSAAFTSPYNPAYPPYTAASAPSPPYTEADENSPYSAPATAEGSPGASSSSHVDAGSEKDTAIYPLPTVTPIAALSNSYSSEDGKLGSMTFLPTAPSAPPLHGSDTALTEQPTSSPTHSQEFQQDQEQFSNSAFYSAALLPPRSPISPRNSQSCIVKSDGPENSKEELALVHAKHDEYMDQLRQEGEHQTELELVQKRGEEEDARRSEDGRE